MTPSQGNTFLVHPSQQLACLCRGLLKGFCFKWHSVLQGPLTCLIRRFHLSRTLSVILRHFCGTFAVISWELLQYFYSTFLEIKQWPHMRYIETRFSILLDLQHYDIVIWKCSKQCKNECYVLLQPFNLSSWHKNWYFCSRLKLHRWMSWVRHRQTLIRAELNS